MPWWNAKDGSRKPPCLGRKRPLRERRAISQARRKRLQEDPDFYDMLFKQASEKMNSPDARKRAGKTRSEGHYCKVILPRILRKRNKSVKMRRKVSSARIREWTNEEMIERRVKGMGRKFKPNKDEKELRRILNKHFPGEFRMNVTDGIVIGGKIPDFVNVNGKKFLVELFGRYWHGNIDGMTEQESVVVRKRHFKQWGFHCAIVWTYQLKDEHAVVKKIRKEMEKI